MTSTLVFSFAALVAIISGALYFLVTRYTEDDNSEEE